ncbi:hypothetical protein WICMUC_000310 [Wickerhamomyces mucosus]|uniref:Holocytochrome c-type synthase n=1 Tax=Wickerhamomyces mucosus TaxID=1378264 RepID=A0A9P8PZK8_9ASCO|nr:hypothetical protein WICMUC_000310 [Wickerhamomyces mucosus]
MSSEQAKCPVDHSAREKWTQTNQNSQTVSTGDVIPHSEESKCPVNHEARSVWLQNNNGQKAPHPIDIDSKSEGDKCPVDHQARAKWAQLSGDRQVVDGKTIATDIEHSSDNLPDIPKYETDIALPEQREISSIPRTDGNGNWIYPSQKQFFEAMKRKNWNPTAKDMETVVPIHNAVNERAWFQILKWEDKRGGDSCGGIQLTSFKGDSKKLTPKAWFWGLLGYQKPFDRHDWTINRCGVEVDYVIDFYTGRPNPAIPQMASFYLDVRPKLNSYEAIKTRALKFFGL